MGNNLIIKYLNNDMIHFDWREAVKSIHFFTKSTTSTAL